MSQVTTAKSSAAIKHIQYVFSEQGEPEAVIIKIKDFNRILETLGIIYNDELMRSIQKSLKEVKNAKKLLTHEEVFGNL